LNITEVEIYINIGAEQIFAAEKDKNKIAVEVICYF
jgi:hypothetical protein